MLEKSLVQKSSKYWNFYRRYLKKQIGSAGLSTSSIVSEFFYSYETLFFSLRFLFALVLHAQAITAVVDMLDGLGEDMEEDWCVCVGMHLFVDMCVCICLCVMHMLDGLGKDMEEDWCVRVCVCVNMHCFLCLYVC